MPWKKDWIKKNPIINKTLLLRKKEKNIAFQIRIALSGTDMRILQYKKMEM